MRSNWKGVISFGLVSIPILLYPTKNKKADISFHQIDRRDNSRIKFQRINVETGKEVPWEDITRGYSYDKETTIPVPDEVLKKVAGKNTRSIDIDTFIPRKDLDILTIENSYYLVPEKKGNKGYIILREALEETNKIGIAKVIISTKEYLAAVLPHQNVLILCLLRYDTETRKITDFDIPTKALGEYKINKKEIDVAKQLIQAMSSKWNPKKYVDEYQKAIHQWVDETVHKLPHPKVKKSHVPKPTTNVVNLVDLLKKSLASKGKHTVTKKTTSSKTYKSPAYLKPKNKTSKHATKH